MRIVAYKVMPHGEKWLVTRDGEPGMSYVSQEAAYEVAVAERRRETCGPAMRFGSRFLDLLMTGLATARQLP
jgi:hypothetical protein